MIRHLLCAISGLLLPLTAQAQATSISADIGSARVRYADSIDAVATSVSPSLRSVGERGTVAASGTFARVGQAWSNSGLLDVTARLTAARRFSTELSAVGGGSWHSDGSRTGRYLASSRARLEGSSRGMWLGGGVGKSWDGVWRNVIQGEAGAWIVAGANVAAVQITPTRVNDTIGYTDAFAMVRRTAERWQLDGTVGYRAGNQLPSLRGTAATWGSVAATLRLTPGIGIVASAGTYPIDLTQGFPGGSFIGLHLRLSARNTAAIRRPRENFADSAVRAFRVERVSGEERRIRVLAPTASRVEIAGDFTSWSAVTLSPQTHGWWSVTLPIAGGKHEVNVRLDGGSWRVPPSLVVVEDEFGGAVGVMLVPR